MEDKDKSILDSIQNSNVDRSDNTPNSLLSHLKAMDNDKKAMLEALQEGQEATYPATIGSYTFTLRLLTCYEDSMVTTFTNKVAKELYSDKGVEYTPEQWASVFTSIKLTMAASPVDCANADSFKIYNDKSDLPMAVISSLTTLKRYEIFMQYEKLESKANAQLSSMKEDDIWGIIQAVKKSKTSLTDYSYETLLQISALLIDESLLLEEKQPLFSHLRG